MHIGFWWESQKERNHYDDLAVGGRLISKRIIAKLDGLIWLRIRTGGRLL
jgi:hypothetical protein